MVRPGTWNRLTLCLGGSVVREKPKYGFCVYILLFWYPTCVGLGCFWYSLVFLLYSMAFVVPEWKVMFSTKLVLFGGWIPTQSLIRHKTLFQGPQGAWISLAFSLYPSPNLIYSIISIQKRWKTASRRLHRLEPNHLRWPGRSPPKSSPWWAPGNSTTRGASVDREPR